MGLSARDKADSAAASASNNTPRSAGSLKPHRKLYIAPGAGGDGWVVVTGSLVQSCVTGVLFPPPPLIRVATSQTTQDEIIANADVLRSSLSGQ